MAENDDIDMMESFKSLKVGSTNSAAVASYYDEWADTYEATLKDWDYQAPDDAAVLLRAHLKPDTAVLDVGCGTGLFAEALSRHVDCQLEGIDISTASLEVAEQQGRYHRLQHHDLQTTPLPLDSNTFDAAACVGVMTYIADAEALLSDLCRIVRPGGHVLFTQRDDRWAEKKFDDLIKTFEDRQRWQSLQVSSARPYLPKNDNYSDEIQVIHVLCRVI